MTITSIGQNSLYPACRVVRSSGVPDQEIQNVLFIPVAAMVFVWGLIWGSFFNVCIYRIPAGKSVVRPGSHCYTCGSFLKWYDNIPVLSYLALRGCCRSCGTWFSSRYLMVELLTGLLFLAVFAVFGFQLQTPFQMVVVSLLIIGTFTDIDHFIIPDGITLGGAAFAVVATGVLGPHSFIADQMPTTWDLVKQLSFMWEGPRLPEPIPYWMVLAFSLLGCAFGYGMLWSVGLLGKLLFRKEAMGMGDVKLFAFLGAWMGPLACIWILFLSALVGALLGLSLLMAHKLMGKDEFDTMKLEGPPTVDSQWLIAGSQSDGVGNDETAKEGETGTAEESGLELQFPRRTARQLHHFPYGPYIALAALIVLLFHRSIEDAVRSFFLLG